MTKDKHPLQYIPKTWRDMLVITKKRRIANMAREKGVHITYPTNGKNFSS
jgi:hypothetical protein